MRFVIELAAAIFLTIAAIFAFAKGANADGIMAMDAVAETSKNPTAKTGAAYVMLMNHGTEEDTLVSITTDAATYVMVHQSKEVDGIMQMDEVAEMPIAPGQTIDMIKQGYHIMLSGLKAPLKKGDQVPLVLTFKRAGQISVIANVDNGVKMKHQ